MTIKRDVLNVGDILFIRGHIYSPVDDAIKLGESILSKDDARYSHVCVYIGNGQVAEAQGFRKSGTNYLTVYKDDYDVGIMDLTETQKNVLLSVLKQEYGLPYDWEGIWVIILKILFGITEHYIEHKRRYCSKFVEWAFNKIGIQLDGTTPESLALSVERRNKHANSGSSSTIK